jgi:CBS-domain-containing membrane protein
MNASDIMTRDPVTVREDTHLDEVVRLMLSRHVSGVPVVAGNGAVIGIVSEGDLLRRAETATERRRPRWFELLLGSGPMAEAYVHAHGRRAGEIMTRDVVTVTPGTTLKEVVALMQRKHVKRLPVVEDGVCVGIIARADLVRALARVLAAEPRTVPDDEAIRATIERAIATSPWGKHTNITVTVENGVVDLDGMIFDDRERAALRVVAENAPGVKEVHDHITWVEPNTGVTFIADEDVQTRRDDVA